MKKEYIRCGTGGKTTSSLLIPEDYKKNCPLPYSHASIPDSLNYKSSYSEAEGDMKEDERQAVKVVLNVNNDQEKKEERLTEMSKTRERVDYVPREKKSRKKGKKKNINSNDEVTETKKEQKQEWGILVPVFPQKYLKHVYVVKYKKNSEME